MGGSWLPGYFLGFAIGALTFMPDGTDVELDKDLTTDFCAAYEQIAEEMQPALEKENLEGSLVVYGPDGEELCTIDQTIGGVESDRVADTPVQSGAIESAPGNNM